MNVEFLD